MSPVPALTPEQLRRTCDEAELGFSTTDELPDLVEVIGQSRAVEALEFGIGIRRPGFNLFAFGPHSAGMHGVVRQSIARRAALDPVPSDWIYVHNFAEPHRPRAIALPPSRGGALRAAMLRMIDDLRNAIPAAFETDEYRARAHVIEEEVKDRHQRALEALEQRARASGVALLRTPVGMGFAPVKGDQVLDPEEFAKLPAEERERITAPIGKLQEELQATIAQFPQWQREGRERIHHLNEEFATHVVVHSIAELRAAFADIADVGVYLDEVQRDIVEHVDLFRRSESPAQPMAFEPALDGDGAAFRRYQVNLLVDHAHSRGAPIVYEPNPSYQNLVGRVEHRQAMGTLITDFGLIKPGALHQANGGYLILDARKVAAQPFAWEGLKQALRSREIRIESLGEAISLISTISLSPEHIPLDVKVVLVDEPQIYYLMHAIDPDLRELFKVPVDFDDRMARDAASTALFARFLATRVRACGLRPLERDAVAALVEHGSRLAGDAERLSTLAHVLQDVLFEADHRAAQRSSPRIARADVDGALAAARRRSSRIRERMLEETERGTILIDTDGERVGQVNGLSVLQVGDTAFGRPTRITARARIGAGQVIDIEREVKLGGPLHSKGVLILSNLLAARFAADEPLSLAASLTFEQSYGGVEGDSASAAELYALLSALADAPIAQRFAVTGSVDQHGAVQAIGGVNEKIEGFFELCRARGLTGRQAVLIPASNVKHLMLERDVVDAVAAGRFAVYPVETIDQGIELLTGVAAGVADLGGIYPEGTINRRVADRLRDFAEKRRRFGEPAGGEKK